MEERDDGASLISMLQRDVERLMARKQKVLVPFGTRRTRRWIPILSISIPGLGWLLFGLYPTVATFFYSLTQYSGEPGTPLHFSWFYNYVQAFTTDLPELTSSLRITFEYLGGTVVLQTLAGLGLALLFNRKGTAFSVYRTLVFMPQVLSVIVVGVVFSLLFDPFSGPVEVGYQHLTGGFSSFFGSQNVSLLLIVLVTCWAGVGFSMVVYMAGLRNIPAQFYEAAAVDGAGRWYRFRAVTWPLLAGSTTVSVFVTATFCLSQYALILVLTDGQQGTMTIGMLMFLSAFGGGAEGASTNLGYGSMLMVLNFVIIVIVGWAILIPLRRREVQL